MAITITAVTRDGGSNCQHVTITVNDEGSTRTVKTSYGEIDAFLDERFDSPQEMKKALVLLWARYRRAQGRAVVNVGIA